MRLTRPDKSGIAMTLYEIATLSSKVRNDRGMDSRLRGNDKGAIGMTKR